MSRSSSDSNRPPASLIAERRAGWHAFTRGVFWNGVAVAATLLFLLIVFRIL
jgi:hypothetical protein